MKAQAGPTSQRSTSFNSLNSQTAEVGTRQVVTRDRSASCDLGLSIAATAAESGLARLTTKHPTTWPTARRRPQPWRFWCRQLCAPAPSTRVWRDSRRICLSSKRIRKLMLKSTYFINDGASLITSTRTASQTEDPAAGTGPLLK
jgi:hypothetical protein